MKEFRHIIILIFLGIIITYSSSCKKYLDKKSDNSLVVPGTIEDAQALMDATPTMNLGIPSAFGESSADDYFWDNTYTTYDALQFSRYTWVPYEYTFNNDWSDGYNAVYHCNLVLQFMDNIPRTAQNAAAWNNAKGSALFYRANNFLNLTWIYAKAYDDVSSYNDLGIALKFIADMNVPTVRSTARESYMQVLRDAKESLDYLPALPAHVLRPSKAAAYGLLARAYLSMRYYDSAFKYSGLALSLKNQLLNYNIQGGDVININANIPFKRFNAETIFYTEMDYANWLARPAVARIDSSLYFLYDANDLRKTAFFAPINGYQKFKGSYGQGEFFPFNGITTAEMYLIRAECYARKGNKDAALADVNTVLVNRWRTGFFTAVTASTAQEALSKILVERRKELLMRGLRWIDIKRLNKEGANIVPRRYINGQLFEILPNSNYYALPLPKDIIELTGIPQNPYP